MAVAIDGEIVNDPLLEPLSPNSGDSFLAADRWGIAVSAYEAISVEPLNPVIGAEISGVDLSKPLANEMWKRIHEAWLAHAVVFFRDQHMSLEQHKTFGRRFGELHIHPASPPP